MIRATNAADPRYNVAQGTLNSHCVQFETDYILNGLKVTIDLGLFISSSNSAGKLSPAYQVNYPITGSGTVTMTLVGTSSLWQNVRVFLTAIDSYRFAVEVKFIQLADLNSYLNTTPFDSYSYFTGDKITGNISVYDAIKFLSVKATVQKPGSLDVAVADTEWKGLRWRTDEEIYLYNDYFFTTGKQVFGWSSTKDLTVRFLKSGTAISARFYGGIIRTRSISVGNWWDDINLQYGTFDEFVSLFDTTFAFDKLIDSRALIGDSYGNYEGLFTIDKSYFETGESYQVFVIWEEEGVLKSALSQPFVEAIEEDLPKLEFTVLNTIDPTENTAVGAIETSNLKGAAPCQELRLCTEIDIPSVNTALTAAGFPYDFDELYNGSLTGLPGEVKIYGTDTLNVNAPATFQDITKSVSYAEGVNIIMCGTFNVPESWAGLTKYVFISLKLYLPSGQNYEFIFPFTISTVDFSEDLTLIGDEANFYCENTEEVEFCFDGVDVGSAFIVKKDGELLSDVGTYESDFSDGDGCVTINYQDVQFGEEICLCLIAQESTVDEPLSCPCGNIEFTFTPYKEGNEDMLTCNVDLSDIIPVPTGEDKFVLVAGDRIVNYSNANTGFIIVPLPINRFQNVIVSIETADGCIYIVEQEIPRFEGTYSVEACPSDIPLRGIPCDKDPSLFISCDTLFWEVNIVDDGGIVDSLEYSFDLSSWSNYVGPVSIGANTEIYARAVITYSEIECGTKELYAHLTAKECGNCYDDLPPINSCQSFLEITVTWDEVNEDLTLQGTDDSSDCSDYTDLGIEYSTDGITYQTYVGPINTTGIDTIYYQWSVECDGCNDSVVGIWERPEECCGGGGGDVNICELLTSLPTTSGIPQEVYFVHINEDGDCVRGTVSLCLWMGALTIEAPVDLTGLYFPYVNSVDDSCGRLLLSDYIGGDGSVINEQDEIQFQDEGVNLGTSGTVDTVDFVGSGVTASRIGNAVTVTIPGETADQDPIQYQDEGVNLGTAGTVTELDYVGAGVTATRSGNKITVTIPDWQKKLQFYEESVALGTSGTVTDINFVGSFGEASRVSNAITVDFGPYEQESNVDVSFVADEFIWFIYIDASGGNKILYLNAQANNGACIFVKKTDNSANTVEIRPDGTDTINGAASSYFLTAQNEGIGLKSDQDGSTGWHIISDVLVNHTGEVTGQRTLSLHKTSISNKTAVTAVGSDYVLIGDTSDSDNLKKALISDFANVTHTGEVTGSGGLTVDKTAISNRTLVTAAKDDHVLIGDASDSDNLKKVKVQTIRNYERVGITVDGGGSVLTAGTKGFTQLKFPTTGATLVGITLLADASGSVEFDILKSTFSGFPTTSSIVGANAPELVSAQKAEITIDGGWTTSFTSGDCLEFEIVGTPATITRVHLIMYYELL